MGNFCRFEVLTAPPRPIPLRLVPVFLPFAGCPQRCLYCHQAAQTGQRPVSSADVLGRVEHALSQVQGPASVGLYGGSFTALPEALQRQVLECVLRHMDTWGARGQVRLSTRPDAVSPQLLGRLRRWGVDVVELGVQSFDSAVLARSGRGYTGAQAHAACRMVHDAGLGLGIQLLPGLPGHTQAHWQEDVERTLAAAPKVVRIYPCVVVEGTPLARLHAEGRYRPWELQATVELVAEALPRLWRRGIRVIRVGLAPQPGFLLQAGPWHPALGNMARSVAMARMLTRAVGARRVERMIAPRWVQGDLWGHGRANAPVLARLGIVPQRVTFDANEGIRIWTV
ncbi:MAG: radical SAM protein [Desulfomicrobiaceae bacterium]